MPSKRFEYVAHTADISFVAYGRNFEEAFSNAAFALLSTMIDIKAVKKIKSKIKTARITDRARTKEDLVWYVLQDILSKIDEKKINAYDFKINHLREKNGEFVLNGCIFYRGADDDHALLSVKAVTPHGLVIKERPGRCSISVVVDV